MTLKIQIDDRDLPILSTVAQQAMGLLNDPRTTNKQIEDVIFQDPPLVARILRVANSPCYRGLNPAVTVRDAILRLGMRNMHKVLITAATGEFFSGRDEVVQKLWNHACTTAGTAQLITEALNFRQSEVVFIAGLLHDIGKLVILRQQPQIYRPMIARAEQMDVPLQLMEEEIFGHFSHMAVGCLLARFWRLHDSIAESAMHHHTVSEAIPPHIVHDRIVCIVALANEFATLAAAQGGPGDVAALTLTPYVRNLHLEEPRLMKIAERVFEHMSDHIVALV